MNVFLPGTFDTKGIEFAFVKSLLEKQGFNCICADAGVLNPPSFAPDISREDVFIAAGTTLKKSFSNKTEAMRLKLLPKVWLRLLSIFSTKEKFTECLAWAGLREQLWALLQCEPFPLAFRKSWSALWQAGKFALL